MSDIIRKLYDNGKLRLLEHRTNGELNNPNENEPAIKEYYKSGQIMVTQDWCEGKKDGVIKSYYESGEPEFISYWSKNKLHRLNNPASIEYYEDGKLRCISFWNNDYYYRPNNKPVYIEYDTKGSIIKEFYV